MCILISICYVWKHIEENENDVHLSKLDEQGEIDLGFKPVQK